MSNEGEAPLEAFELAEAVETFGLLLEEFAHAALYHDGQRATSPDNTSRDVRYWNRAISKGVQLPERPLGETDIGPFGKIGCGGSQPALFAP